jgi:hypothetical protein
MIDLSRVVAGNLLTESYSILRSTGYFAIGGYKTKATEIPGFGVVSVATDQDLLMVPEGDRVSGAMVFHSEQRIYETQMDAHPPNSGFGQGGYDGGTYGSGPTQHVSDIILWNFQKYRILNVGPYPNRQYWRAIGVRLSGQ